MKLEETLTNARQCLADPMAHTVDEIRMALLILGPPSPPPLDPEEVLEALLFLQREGRISARMVP